MPDWPELTVERDHPTLAIIHLASQMLGKLRVAQAPWVNHGWHVALRPIAGGLATAPTDVADGRSYTLALDFIRHAIVLQVSDGADGEVALDGANIADLHAGLIALLGRHRIPSRFDGLPNEMEAPVRFADDRAPRRYERGSAERFRDVLALVVPVFDTFRAGFSGKASPVHFFWGSFDLAATRFSGRRAPQHPGGVPGLPDRVTREAYDQQLSSAGFWPGGVMPVAPVFYSYAYPEPPGFRDAAVAAGSFDSTLGEYVLPYAEVRASLDPAGVLASFLESTYAAAAVLGDWDRAALEREPLPPS